MAATSMRPSGGARGTHRAGHLPGRAGRDGQVSGSADRPEHEEDEQQDRDRAEEPDDPDGQDRMQRPPHPAPSWIRRATSSSLAIDDDDRDEPGEDDDREEPVHRTSLASGHAITARPATGPRPCGPRPGGLGCRARHRRRPGSRSRRPSDRRTSRAVRRSPDGDAWPRAGARGASPGSAPRRPAPRASARSAIECPSRQSRRRVGPCSAASVALVGSGRPSDTDARTTNP